MKKDRNAFFADAHMTQSSYMPNMQMQMPMQMPNGNAPYQMGQASQSYYSGPNPGYTNTYYDNNADYSELDNRLSKIERQINRLDSRITRLENNSGINIVDKDNFSSNMYMV